MVKNIAQPLLKPIWNVPRFARFVLFVGILLFLNLAQAGITKDQTLKIFNLLVETVKTPDLDYSLDIDPEIEYVAMVNLKKSMPSIGNLPPMATIELAEAFAENADPLMIAVVIAHELGHLVGHPAGGDYSPLFKRVISAEGEADYQIGKILRQTYLKNPTAFRNVILRHSNLPNQVVDEVRRSLRPSGISGSQLEITSLVLAAAYGSFFLGNVDRNNVIAPRPKIRFDGRDLTQVRRTLPDYPSDQSRYDSVRAGLFQSPRPRSWANPADFMNGCNDALKVRL